MPKRILVVESDSAFSRVLCDNFAFDGFDVLAVGDRGGAMEAVRKFAPDLIVIGDAAPGTDAASLMASLRQEHQTPVLMLTPRARSSGMAPPPADSIAGQRVDVACVSEVLRKPFDLEDLLQRTRALLALPAWPT